MSSQPIFKRELGPIGVAVFENTGDEERRPLRSISLSRRYFDRQSEEWKSSVVSLNPGDVSAAVRLLQTVEEFLLREV